MLLNLSIRLSDNFRDVVTFKIDQRYKKYKLKYSCAFLSSCVIFIE